jgi:hypothetical protein
MYQISVESYLHPQQRKSSPENCKRNDRQTEGKLIVPFDKAAQHLFLDIARQWEVS